MQIEVPLIWNNEFFMKYACGCVISHVVKEQVNSHSQKAFILLTKNYSDTKYVSHTDILTIDVRDAFVKSSWIRMLLYESESQQPAFECRGMTEL